MPAALRLTRARILGFRRRVGHLDTRLPAGKDSLRRAAWAGLQDSMPRAALLSIHARVEDARPDTWEDPSLVQVWGPRFSVFVVAASDRAVFTVGRTPLDPAKQRFAAQQADSLEAWLGGSASGYGAAGHSLGVFPNSLRYATTTGRVILRWDGARQPVVRMVAPPEVDPGVARVELARRHLHVFGPSTPDSFARWAGVTPAGAAAVFAALQPELIPVRTPIGAASLLASDETTMRGDPTAPAPSRLLPSGDAYWLMGGDDRTLLVPDAARRERLWTSRVWPGAILLRGQVAGTWRRAGERLVVDPWRRLTAAERAAVEAEAAALPLPGAAPVSVTWAG